MVSPFNSGSEHAPLSREYVALHFFVPQIRAVLEGAMNEPPGEDREVSVKQSMLACFQLADYWMEIAKHDREYQDSKEESDEY